MQVQLVVAKGQHHGKKIPIKKSQFVIGRHRDCQLSVSSSKVSVHHCAILLRQQSAWVRDFDSTNGTFLNGERVKGDCELHHGDRLRIGSLTVEVHLDMDAPDVVESSPATKKLRSVTEEKAASLLHKQSWNEIDDGILTTGPESSYELTDLKIPAVETPPERAEE